MSSSSDDVRYAMLVEWFDTQASLIKQYNLLFWPSTHMLEMYDIKNRRTFLKKMQVSTVKVEDLFIGATLNVYSRQLKIIDFADEFTRRTLSKTLARTICFVKPKAQSHLGQIISSLNNDELKELSSGIGTAIELVYENAIEALHTFTQTNGEDNMAKYLIISVDEQHYNKFKHCIFESKQSSTAISSSSSSSSTSSSSSSSSCTMAVIKPHAVSEQMTGDIITSIIGRGFTISAIELFYLDRPAAEEFFEVYKGVIPQYCPLVEQWTSGACIAMQIEGGDDIVERMRDVAGPHDPEIGKHIRPNTLRARFGHNRIENAVHVTDLHEDGTLESEFFFKILQDAKVF